MSFAVLPQEHLDTMVAEIAALRDALEDLVEDTEHIDHDCGDEDCCVAVARRVLATGKP